MNGYYIVRKIIFVGLLVHLVVVLVDASFEDTIESVKNALKHRNLNYGYDWPLYRKRRYWKHTDDVTSYEADDKHVINDDTTPDETERFSNMLKRTLFDKNKFLLNMQHPKTECPRAEDGLKLFACPKPEGQDERQITCIDDHDLCDNVKDCPNGEDENQTVCMFHTMTMKYFRLLLDAVFGLTRSVV